MKLGSIAAYVRKGGQSHYVTERPMPVPKTGQIRGSEKSNSSAAAKPSRTSSSQKER